MPCRSLLLAAAAGGFLCLLTVSERLGVGGSIVISTAAEPPDAAARDAPATKPTKNASAKKPKKAAASSGKKKAKGAKKPSKGNAKSKKMSATPAILPADGKPRVALVCVAAGANARDTLALAEALLSQEAGLTLVDRTEIDRCLLELELSLSGGVDSRHAVRVGQLASAQVFAMLELSPETGRPLGLVVFDTRTGLRLADKRLPGGDAEKRAEAIRRIVLGAVKKRAGVGKDVKTVCLNAVRNDDLPNWYNGVCSGMHHLIENKLTNIEGLAVLERRRLDRVTREKALGGGKDFTDLSASLLMVHVDLQQGSKPKLLRAVASLTTVAGKELARVSVEGPRNKIWDLAGQLVRALAPKLDVAAPEGEVDRGEEARRFTHQAKALYVAGRYQEALASIEAACALDSDDVETLSWAAKLNGFFARVPLTTMGKRAPPELRSSPTAVEMSESFLSRALDYRRAMYERLEKSGKPLVTNYQVMEHSDAGAYMAQENDVNEAEITLAFEGLASVVRGHTPKTLDALKRLQRRYRDLEIGLIHESVRRTVKDRASYIHYTNYLRVLLNNVDLFSNTSEEWTTDTIALVDGWLPLAEKYGVYHNSFCNINMMMVATMDRVAQLDRNVGTGLWKITPHDDERLNPLFEKMSRHKEPAVAVLGRLGMLSRLFNDGKRPPDQTVREAFLTLGKHAEKALDQPCRHQPESRAIIYCALLDGLEFLGPLQDKIDAVMTLHAVMLGRKELTYGVAMKASEPHYITRSHYDPFRYRLPNLGMHELIPEKHFPVLIESADLALRLSDDPEVQAVDGSLGRTRAELFYLRDMMGQARPDLIKPASVPWKKSAKLFSIADHPGLRSVSTPVSRGEYVYAVCEGQTPKWPLGYIQLVRVRIADGDVKLFAPIGKGYCPHSRGRMIQMASNHNLAIGDRYAYVTTTTYGVCRIDLTVASDPNRPPGRKDPPGVSWIDMRRGLPSNFAVSVALLGDKLYAQLGDDDGFLVSVSVRKQKVDTIVSSRRSAQETPLDNADDRCYFLQRMFADPAEKRLYFTVTMPRSQAGLWQLDTDTNALTRVMPLGREPNWHTQESDGNLLLAIMSKDTLEWSLVRFDVRTLKASVVYSSTPTPCFPSPAIDSTTRVVPKAFAQPPYAMLEDWLWTTEPLGRISRDGRTQETYPSLEPYSLHLGDYLMRRHNYMWRSLDLLDSGRRVLFGNKSSLWLLDLQ